MSEKRVVITGIGVVSPIGTGTETFWNAAVKGTNGVRPLTTLDTTDFKTKVGGEVKDFTATDWLDNESIDKMGLSSQYAVAACKMAAKQSGIDFAKENSERVAVSVGTTMGEPQILRQGIDLIYANNKSSSVVPRALPGQYPCNAIPANLARHFNASGPVTIIPTACAAGNYAIGYGLDLIKMGKADCVISGGSDPFSRIAFTGFNRLLATASERVAPFSKGRDGMAVAEGAGILILEELERAKKRGVEILAEVLGYGLACDAFSMTIPSPTGEGGIRSFKRALNNSRIAIDDVDYICAHGTGTGENDRTETLIAKKSLGDRAAKVPMSSIKSMLGHTMGAASAIEAAACVLMLQRNTLLPTINYSEPDPECDLDYVVNQAREQQINTVVSNAFAFGGNTSSLVLKSYKG